MKLRCPHRIHGILQEDGTWEVKCDSRGCGAGGGVVVFHYFNIDTGELVRDKKFKDPVRERKER